MRNSKTPIVSAATLALIGLALVFGPLFHLVSLGPVHANIFVFHRVIHAVNVVSLPIVGVILIYISIYIFQRRRSAAILSVALGFLLLAYLLILYPHGKITPFVVLLIVVYMVIMAITHRQFTIRNNLEGIAPYVRRIFAIALIGFIYGVIGFYFFAHIFFWSKFSLWTSIELTMDSLTGFSGTIAEPTRLGELFIDSLGGIGIVIYILLLDSLFRPLRFRALSHQHEIMARAEMVIQQKSRSSEDFFKLWPNDKRYYFSADDQTFIAYKQSGRTVIILGDPTGNHHNASRIIGQFLKYCRSLGWSVAVINATAEGQKLYEAHGLSSLFIGNEGVIDIAKFMESTKGSKHFRYVTNKAARDRLEVEEWDALTPERWAKLRNISHDWLSRGGRREYGFFMGYFDHKYLEQCRVFVLLQNNHPVAYINLIPTFYKGHASIDHLRYKASTSPVGMHFLMMKIIEGLHTEKTKSLNIGLAPLSGITKGEAELLPRAALRIIRLLGASYYSFEGLEQFKSKFKPSWEPRAILYGGTPASLIRVARDIEHASAYSLRGNRSTYISTIAGIVVLTLGLYLILA